MMYSAKLISTTIIKNINAILTENEVDSISESLVKFAMLEFRHDNAEKDISRLSFHLRAVDKFILKQRPTIQRNIIKCDYL